MLIAFAAVALIGVVFGLSARVVWRWSKTADNQLENQPATWRYDALGIVRQDGEL